MQVAARGQPAGEQGDEGRLDQAPLLLALLRPGVGEKDVDAGQRLRRQHVAHHLHCIVLDHAQVAQLTRGNFLEQAADARGVHFDAEKVVLWMRGGDDGRGLAHAAADLQDAWRLAAKRRVKIEQVGAVGDAPARHALFVETSLCFGDAALAQHETADVAVAARLGGIGIAHSLAFGLCRRQGSRQKSALAVRRFPRLRPDRCFGFRQFAFRQQPVEFVARADDCSRQRGAGIVQRDRAQHVADVVLEVQGTHQVGPVGLLGTGAEIVAGQVVHQAVDHRTLLGMPCGVGFLGGARLVGKVEAGAGQQREAMRQAEQALAHQYIRLLEGVAQVQRRQGGRERGRRVGSGWGFLRRRHGGKQRQQQAGGDALHLPAWPISPPLGELGLAA
jgi:hypothetical protein